MYINKIKNKAISVLLLSSLIANNLPVYANGLDLKTLSEKSLVAKSTRSTNVIGTGKGSNGAKFNENNIGKNDKSTSFKNKNTSIKTDSNLNIDDYWERNGYGINSFSLNTHYKHEPKFVHSTEGYDNTIVSVGKFVEKNDYDNKYHRGLITIFDKDTMEYIDHKLVTSNSSSLIVEFTGITKTVDGDGYICYGIEKETGRYADYEAIMIKFDKDFNEIKRTTLSFAYDTVIRSIDVVDGNYVLAVASTYSTRRYIIKYDENLSQVSRYTFDKGAASSNILLKYNDADGHYYCLSNNVIYKLDKDYNEVKSVTSNKKAYHFDIDTDGSIVTLAYGSGASYEDGAYYLEKYNSDFNLVSSVNFAGYDTFQDEAQVVITDDGYLCNITATNTIVKFNKDLEKVSEFRFPFNPDEYEIYTFYADDNGSVYPQTYNLLSDGTVLISGHFKDKLNLLANVRYYGTDNYVGFTARLDTNTMNIVGGIPELKGYSEGDGSKGNPFIIDNIERLHLLRNQVNLGLVNIGHNFKLNADIDLNDYDPDGDSSNGNWIPIGVAELPFVANFDGNNHTIKNLKIYNDDIETGFFEATFESTIKNLTFENVDIKSDTSIGIIASCLEASKLDNIKILGDIRLEGYSMIGCLAGWSWDLEVSNVYVDSPTIYGYYEVGGLIGEQASADNYSFFTNCIIENLNMIIYADGGYVGGFSGYAYEPVYNECHITGKIKVENMFDYACIGGFFGEVEIWELENDPEFLVNNSSSKVDIYASGPDEGWIAIGGFVGECYGEKPEISLFNNSTYEGTIVVDNSSAYIGGLIGYAEEIGTMYKSSANAIIETNASEVGGLIGIVEGWNKIEQSYAIGKIKGDGNAGGLVGNAIEGIVIENSYADLTIEGSRNVGGLVGIADPSTLEIRDSYAAVPISNLNNILSHGPIIGGVTTTGSDTSQNTNIVDVYYDKDIVETYNTYELSITGLKTEQMISLATYDNMNLDYDNIWYIRGNNYPIFNYTNTPPIINEYTVELAKGSDFNAIDYLVATDGETTYEDLVKTVVRDEVNTSIVGTHEVEFEVVDEGGLSDRGIVNIRVLDDASPVITAFDKVVYLYNDINLFENVAAIDAEDGDITKDIKVSVENIDTSKVGVHKVVYEVTDTAKNTTKKEVKVEVIKGDVNTPSISYEDELVDISDNGTNIPAYETEDFEDEDLLIAFTNSNWTIENGKMKSEDIENYKSTENSFEIIANEGDKLYIDSTVSNQYGSDIGMIYLNNTHITSLTGQSSQTQELKLGEGLNTIKLVYKKDSYGVDGDDCFYIDEIRYVNGTKPVDSLSYKVDGSEWSIYDSPFKLDGYNPGDIVLVEAKATADGIDSDIRKKYISVGGNRAPELFVDDNIKTEINKDFNYKDYVKAEDFEDGDITDDVIMKGDLNTGEEGEYEVSFEVTDSGGLTVDKTVTITVVVPNRIPVIHASDLEIVLNSEFDAKDHATATDEEDGDITDRIIVKEDNVNTSIKGDYKVTYEVTDNANVTVSKTIKVSVIDYEEIFPPSVDEAPVINASDKTLYVGDKFDKLSGVTAMDKEDGNITHKIKVDYNNVDTSKVGIYKVSYSVEDSSGNKTSKDISVTVKAKENSAPVINANDKVLYIGDTFKPLEGVTATDKEDGDLTKSIVVKSNNVDTSKAGEYKVTYEVTDSKGNTTTKTIKVVVKNKAVDNTNDSDNTNKPQTGDNMLIYYALTLSSLLGLIVLNKKDRFKNKINK